MKKSRYPELRMVDGKKVCRGCSGEIPKNRQTWCSKDCYERNCPQRVIFHVNERDKGICQLCFKPTRHIARSMVTMNWQEWIDYRRSLDRAEYDHIIPFSEGGKTVLENMRTLCRSCHVRITSEWRKKKSVVNL